MLLAAGLRDTHRLVDVGCGSLRAGRMLIPYLCPGRFSHAYPDPALTGLKGIAEALAPEGKLFATFYEGPTNPTGSGWLYPDMMPYTWQKMNAIVEESGLVARRLASGCSLVSPGSWRHTRTPRNT